MNIRIIEETEIEIEIETEIGTETKTEIGTKIEIEIDTGTKNIGETEVDQGMGMITQDSEAVQELGTILI